MHHGCDLGQGELDLDVGLEEDLDYRDALVALAFRVLHVINGGGQRAFTNGDHAPVHLGRRQARVSPHDGDHGDVDVGKDVLGRFKSTADAKQGDQHGQDNKGIRAAQSQPNNPHAKALSEGRA